MRLPNIHPYGNGRSSERWKSGITQKAVQGGTSDTQKSCRLGLIPAALIHGGLNGIPIQLASGSRHGAGCVAAPELHGQILGLDHSALGFHQGKMDGILQFPNISGPGVIHQHGQRILGKAPGMLSFLCGPIEEMRNQKREIVFPLTQGRQANGYHVQPIIEIFSKILPFHFTPQVAVGGTDDAHIHRDGLFASHPLESSFLQEPCRSFTCMGLGSSDTSSRKIVPPWASSKRPFLSRIAPEKAPFTCPKSSLSSNPSGRAPQFTGTNGPPPRRLSLWIAAATSSFPVPVSPAMWTV